MTCERYWREGVVLVERGEEDPHRATCLDCSRAHASRQELIEALPLIGAEQTGDPHWQAKVWRRLDEDRRVVGARWRWPVLAAFAAACAVALWFRVHRAPPGDVRPSIDIVEGPVAMRSGGDAKVGDSLRIRVNAASEVWIYRDGRLAWRCRALEVSSFCVRDAVGMTMKVLLSTTGTYRVFVVDTPASAPVGNADEDYATLVDRHAVYTDHTIQVR